MSSFSVGLHAREEWNDTVAFFEPSKLKRSCSTLYIILAFTLLGLCIILAIVFGIHRSQHTSQSFNFNLTGDIGKVRTIGKRAQEIVDGKRILESIRWLAENVHVAGTIQNQRIIDRLSQEYRQMGFEVQNFNYEVLLSYPNYSQPTIISFQMDDESGWVEVGKGLSSASVSEELQGQENDDKGRIWWGAYSSNGTAEGQIVYANYGRAEDFEELEKAGIIISGKIVLCRYGATQRALKVMEAEKRGAVGAMIFSDPKWTQRKHSNMSFPDEMSLPGDEVQRGSFARAPGDPETPGFPSLPFVPRLATQKLKCLPKIPVTPIGAFLASKLMRLLDGPVVMNMGWQGGLDSLYRLSGSQKFKFSVSSHLERRPIANIIATLQGDIEPDRWIMMGNHVDAWVKGAIDPGTGTAIQLEVARSIAESAKHFKPRRSVVFCHWDAEEFGMIGSSEWLEHVLKIVDNRAVAMINVDHVSGNSSLQISAVPLLYKVLSESASSVYRTNHRELNGRGATLLDSWRGYFHRTIGDDKSLPYFGFPGGSSDHQRFISFAGIPSADVKLVNGLYSYSLYHSKHEVPWIVEKFISADGSALADIAKYAAEVLVRLSHELILPFSASHYASALSQWTDDFQITLDKLQKKVPSYEQSKKILQEKITQFRNTADSVDKISTDISLGRRGVSISLINQINERYSKLERMFLDPLAFPSSLNRHLRNELKDSVLANHVRSRRVAQLHDSTESSGGVIFALKVLCNAYTPEDVRLLGWFPVPSRYACWAELVLIQILTPNASFIGHLAGIVAGLFYTMGPLHWIIERLLGDGDPSTRAWPNGDPSTHAWPGEGRSFRNDRYTQYDYTGGLSEEEQIRRAMDESQRHRNGPRYGWITN